MKTDEEVRKIIRSIIARKRAHRKALAEVRSAEAAVVECEKTYGWSSIQAADARSAYQAARSKEAEKTKAIQEAEAKLRS